MIRLVQTCSAMPEQYDAYFAGERVGYLRLRHGRFTVQCPHVGDELVYSAAPEGDGFFMAEERDYYLRFAVRAILDWLERGRMPLPQPPAPEVSYEIA